MVVMVVFQGFFQDRAQQRLRLSRLLTFLLPVEIFKVFAQDRVQQQFQSRTFPLQFHVVEVFVVVFTVFLRFRAPQFFRTFPRPKKSAKVRAHSRSELAAHSSSSTPGAYGVVSSLEEPVQEEEKEEHQVSPMPDSIEWVELSDANGRTYFWNRRSQATVWKTPPGVQIVWVGERDEEGDVWYWHRRTRASGYFLPPLPPE